ncbi:hypothetical protein EHI8A_125290 [Entamoeba histolytica HM-1:IMSS-B]|uniref:Uncharacterized protein n=6 Tax=Entamoeba histolytica TaxID=5759 RepID=B1N533_ENTH1|nr:hypothetical protein EHI_198220 [Entamoeba histolytica HM-1:IMSS]EMD49559.1 Hypothetical protein EHI5A_110200 [Entamoeba histolytica KU27]EMH75298.1 hypothetical protein EHI8A_125290 [Entamoeba histolytica HM-1:IMSS-B]EMS14132.1 hypothetical protein KM1_186770 [Entamoeba histolytica HM-3:IMSS]ENY60223.1 hypothetical protein EHI7A_115780 [Entamoeba histolytica HM-1:IMSS-A]GAT99152.1 hypothetical protein CL6EHI_198220 [Entamoeba histolytica]|eukprot:XP_001914299.1 hypothetical protein EHI_198220 [Entamoeba histolytica HM-1:IMSS]
MFQSDTEKEFEFFTQQLTNKERDCTSVKNEEHIESSIEDTPKEINHPLNKKGCIPTNTTNQRNHIRRVISQSYFLEYIHSLLGNTCVNCDRHISNSSRKIVNGHTVILQEFQKKGDSIINVDEIIQYQFGYRRLSAYEKGGWTFNFLKDSLSFYGFEIHEKKIKKGCYKSQSLKGTLITSITIPDKYISLLMKAGINVFGSRISDQQIDQIVQQLRLGYENNQLNQRGN